MTELSFFFRYAIRLLLIAGSVEFLIGRTLSRVGGMLNPSLVTDVINAVATAGLRLLEPMNVLALGTLAVAAAWPWLAPGGPTGPPLQPGEPPGALGRYPAVPLQWPRLWTPLIGVFVLISLGLTVLPPADAVKAGFNLLAGVLVVGSAGLFAWRGRAPASLRLALGMLGLAFAGYYLYVIIEVLRPRDAQGLPAGGGSLGDLGIAAHFAGEALAMLWTFALLAAVGPWGPPGVRRPPVSWPRLAVAVVPGVLLAVAPFFETWMQGVLARMSIGFTLFLPSPVIALAAIAYVYALLTCWAPGAPAQLGIPWLRELGAGLILLPVGGFDLLSNYQLTVAVLAMLLLTGLVRPLTASPAPAEVRGMRYEV